MEAKIISVLKRCEAFIADCGSAPAELLADIRELIKPQPESLPFVRLPSDCNGNPRYWVNRSYLNTDEELNDLSIDAIERKRLMAHARANKAGGSKYRGKRFGGGFVFSTYSIDETATIVGTLTGRQFKAHQE